jgi:hypothetical protein
LLSSLACPTTAIVLERLEATIKKVIVAERLLETSGSGSSR